MLEKLDLQEWQTHLVNICRWYYGSYMGRSKEQLNEVVAAFRFFGVVDRQRQVYRWCFTPLEEMQALQDNPNKSIRTAREGQPLQSWTSDLTVANTFGDHKPIPPGMMHIIVGMLTKPGIVVGSTDTIQGLVKKKISKEDLHATILDGSFSTQPSFDSPPGFFDKDEEDEEYLAPKPTWWEMLDKAIESFKRESEVIILLPEETTRLNYFAFGSKRVKDKIWEPNLDWDEHDNGRKTMLPEFVSKLLNFKLL